MAAEVLRTLQAAVEVDGRRVTLRRGDEVPEGISDRDRQRLERRGSVVSSEQLASELSVREGFKNAGESDATADATAEPGASERTRPAADTGLEAQIRDGKLKVDETVALANGDPATAERVLAAEAAANDGKPRKGVAEQLQAIIDGS